MSEITVYAFGEVGWELRLQDVVSQTNAAKEGDTVNVLINSPGGFVDEGYAIYDYLKALQAKDVTVNTEIYGMCASIATVIALAGQKRSMAENAQFMIHNPWGGPVGDADEISKYADELKKIESKLAQFYADKTGGELEEISSMMKEETYMDAQKALDMGFITEIKAELKAVAKIKFNNQMSNSNKSKGLLAQIKSLFAKLEEGAPVALDVTLADGTIANVETEAQTPAVGDAVTIGGEAAPDGTHELADGSSIVTVGGVITEIMVAEEDEDDEKYAELKAENAELLAALEEAKAKLEALAKAKTKAFDIKREAFKQKEVDPSKGRFNKNDLKTTPKKNK